MYKNGFNPEKIPLPPTFKHDPSKPLATDANRHHVNDPNIVKAMTAAYYAKVTMVDDNVGQLLEEIRQRGLADDTVIIFTADHGNMLGDHNRWFKGVMYESSTRIPLLMKAPATSPFSGQFNRGAVVSQIVENIDVMPTLCEMIGVPLPAQGIQGCSMTKLVAGQDATWKNRAFAERNSSMIRTAQYKLIKNSAKEVRKSDVGSEYELYDMFKDPLEIDNLAADPAHAAAYAKNAGDYVARLEALRQKMHAALDGVKQREIITFHEAFPYFASEFGLKIAAVVEREPGSEPSAGELAQTIRIVREHHVRALFAEPQYPARSAQMIQRETGVPVRILDPAVTGPLDPAQARGSYLRAMEANLKVLQEALK